MKRGRVIALLLAAGISSAAFMTGCANQSNGTSKVTEQKESNYVLSFVAADKTNWDQVVTIGNHTYTIAVNLSDDNSFELKGTCVGIAEETGQQEGMAAPGTGAPDMQETEPVSPGTEDSRAADSDTDNSGEKSAQTEDAGSKSTEDLTAYDFTINGTWSYEDGWGYTLTFDDGQDTSVTANFDKASSRQYFYYDLAPTVDGEAQEAVQVQFQAKDVEFRNEMADDYVIAEERNATYIFEGNGNSQTGNAINIKIYCEEDGTVAVLSQNGSTMTYSGGTWTEDTSTHEFTIDAGGPITADYCDISGKEGYRLNYTSTGGMGPSTTLTCYLPLAEGITSDDYTDEDFEGTVVKNLTCTEADYTIELTEKGFLKVCSEGTVNETSTYTYNEGADTYSLIIGGQTYNTTKNGDTYTVDVKITVTSMFGTEEYERTFTFQ